MTANLIYVKQEATLKIERAMSQLSTFNLPAIYVIYSLNSYKDDTDFLNYIRTLYKEEVIQIIGTFNYGISKNNIYSYDELVSNLQNKTTNEDINNSPECASTPFGCCPDGFSASNDIFGTDCKPLPCSLSSFGCCKDGTTAAIDDQGTNCPVLSNFQKQNVKYQEKKNVLECF